MSDHDDDDNDDFVIEDDQSIQFDSELTFVKEEGDDLEVQMRRSTHTLYGMREIKRLVLFLRKHYPEAFT